MVYVLGAFLWRLCEGPEGVRGDGCRPSYHCNSSGETIAAGPRTCKWSSGNFWTDF